MMCASVGRHMLGVCVDKFRKARGEILPSQLPLPRQSEIPLMAIAMNFVRAEREFRVPPSGGTLYHR